MFKKPSDPQKPSTWVAPPRIQTLKSKKQRKPLTIPQAEKPEQPEKSVEKIETRVSDKGLVDDSQDLQEESKHNTSKRSMQKYLLQFFPRKPED